MKAAWIAAAKCKDAYVRPGDWEMFPEDRFPTHQSQKSPAYDEEIRRLRTEFCWQCPVRVACFRTAMADPDLRSYGMAGGTTPRDRERVMAMDCPCGVPLDPKDILVWRTTCPDCRPVRSAASCNV